jgi:hypothetical protein
VKYCQPGTIARIDDEAVWCWQRGTAHMKKFPINGTTLLIFYWLVAQQMKRHGGPFNKSRRGRDRRAAKRLRMQERWSWMP